MMDIARLRYLAGIKQKAKLKEEQNVYDYSNPRIKQKFAPQGDLEWRDAMGPNRQTNKMGDNPMVKQEVVEGEVDECGGEPNGHAAQLKDMLLKAGVKDADIAAGSLQLTPDGYLKVARSLGYTQSDGDHYVKKLLGTLADIDNHNNPEMHSDYMSSMGGDHAKPLFAKEEEELDEEEPVANPGPEGMQSPISGQQQQSNARYSHTSDFMGNVTINDNVSGKSVYLQGTEAADFLQKVENADEDDQQMIMSEYDTVMESESGSKKKT